MSKRKLVYLYFDLKSDMKNIVLCPNCCKPIEYGKLINNTGHMSCPDCYDDLAKHIAYMRSEMYHLYRDSKHLYTLDDRTYYVKATSMLHNYIMNYQKQLMELNQS